MERLNRFEMDASKFRNIYWHIRAARSANRRRRWYRYAAKEKARLAGLGWSLEVVRLYGLHLRDTTREPRRYRFEKALYESEYWPVQLAFEF